MANVTRASVSARWELYLQWHGVVGESKSAYFGCAAPRASHIHFITCVHGWMVPTAEGYYSADACQAAYLWLPKLELGSMGGVGTELDFTCYFVHSACA